MTTDGVAHVNVARRPVRFFSVWRLLLSVVLGLLLPLGYAFLLSSAFDYLHRTPPDYLIWPIGWPRPLWILTMGRQPRESDYVYGLTFVILCNVALYGSMVYGVLTMLALVRRRRVEYEPPPPPEVNKSATP